MADIKLKVPNLRFKGFTDYWEQRKLGDFGSVAMNKRIFKKQTTEVGDVPFYKIGTFGKKPDAYISNELFEEYKSKYPYPKEGDLLISASGSIGRIVEYKGQKAYYQDSNIVWLKHNDQLNNLFLKAFYQIVKWDGTEGSTIKRLYNKNILRTRIFLPTTLEQEKVGNIIECIERLLTLQQRKLELLKQLKKGFLQKMFAEKNNKQPVLRFKGFHDDWEQRKLGEIVEWSKGSGLSKDALNIQGIGVPVIHYADLYKFNSVQKEVIHWTMNDIGTKIPENNLLFPMSDVTPDGLARTSTVLQSNVKAGGDVLIAKLNKDILSTFMSYQINRNKNQILPLVTGTTVRHINSKSLSTLKVTVPGKNEQKYVGSILMRFDSLIALHQRKQNHLKLLKKSLLPQMFM